MAKKSRSPLEKQVNRLWNRAGHNLDAFVKMSGLDPDSATGIINNLLTGHPLVKSRYEEIVKETIGHLKSNYLRGEGLMSEVYSKEGKDYIIKDFAMEPGAGLFDSDIDPDTIQSYQIIMGGDENGEGRHVTTHANQSMEGALQEMEQLLKSYSDFVSSEIVIRVFIPNEA